MFAAFVQIGATPPSVDQFTKNNRKPSLSQLQHLYFRFTCLSYVQCNSANGQTGLGSQCGPISGAVSSGSALSAIPWSLFGCRTLWLNHKIQIWAASWQHQQNATCAKRRLRSAWASAQYDQSLASSVHEETWCPPATHWAHCEDSDQTGRMPKLIWVFAGHAGHFVGFVMRRFILG